ncbi:MAG: pilus assembly PilX N-terminal domain-containing protein [Acidobacteria bacterium]|nr:pilus assembly PilX N-terminal domain-containing protein [Acidobacteriota bacterium]
MANQVVNKVNNSARKNERGSAIVISLFVLALITVFVALAISRTSAEASAVGNETAEARTFYAAQGSLEVMTRNFNKVFETKLNPTTADLNTIRTAAVPNITGYTFQQELDQTSTRQNVVVTGGTYSGLYAIRDNWRLRTTATDNLGVQVQLTRNVLNSRVPIFQFGIFYDDDLELYRPPRFSFGGRVHSNRHFFLSPGTEGVYFNSKVTTAGQIVTQSWRNWYTGDSSNNQTFIKNASGVDRQLLPTMGSVLNTTEGAANNMFSATPDLPPSRDNTSFETQAAIFDGNLENETKVLRLPLKVGYPTDLVEIVKRPKKAAASGVGGDLHANASGTLEAVTTATEDDYIMRTERYGNKPGIRVTLADSKAKLPGCASGSGITATTGVCGVRLDGDSAGFGADPSPTAMPTPERARGYRPLPMKNAAADTTFNYQATRLNGERFYMGHPASGGVTGREVWIKVELIAFDDATQNVVARDITADFLSLGITEQATEIRDSSSNLEFKMQHTGYSDVAPTSSLTATTAQTASTGTDSRAILKLQRFLIRGPEILSGSSYTSWYDVSGGTPFNVVERYSGSTQAEIDLYCNSGCTQVDLDGGLDGADTTYLERFAHLKRVSLNNVADRAIVPFPIKMFDTREGEYYDERSTTYLTNLTNVTRNGVMSMIDVDIANLRRFFRGDFNGLFPTTTPFATTNGASLRNTDVPQREGWVFYVSDRRGDADFDGAFDMEDVYSPAPGNTGTLQTGEDLNADGILQTAYGTETERFNTNTIAPDRAAVQDHKYYRRGVRLVNGTTIPGIYDSTTPSNTRGFSFASENGIYVQGNYNATGVASVPSTGNTPFSDYQPYNTAVHIPASIVGDAVTILSNSWNDAKSFSSPYDEGNRIGTTTTMRFAMISGDTIANRETTPNQGGITPKLNGGVHNFKRFLERWTGNRLDYTGSLINLYNSHNNNGSFKCCNTVYDPPIRNWVFDSTFLDPARLPPGTPFFQYVQTTGFQRTND